MIHLHNILAKSPRRRGEPPEPLTDHSAATLRAAQVLRRRIGELAVLPANIEWRFWTAVSLAALLHDAGKVASGFQAMVSGRGHAWGQRHEVVSLGFLPALLDDPDLRSWVALGVATHHRPLSGGDRSMTARYGGIDLGQFRTEIGEVLPDHVSGLLRWFAATGSAAGLPLAYPTGAVDALANAHVLFRDLLDTWAKQRVPSDHGLAAVLLQGAVTLADHLASAHGQLLTAQPLNGDFPPRLHEKWAQDKQTARLHQHQAAAIDGHLLLCAPTGSGKTEASLLWASRQVDTIASATGATPRVFYTLPYLASINAMADRLTGLLAPPQDTDRQDGHADQEIVGVSHSKAGSYYLAAAATPEDDDTSANDRTAAARKAVARAAATRLFRETVRVGTPYQLLRGALAGPAHSSILVDMANSVLILDELHAYDAKRLGFILAMVRFWRRLGGRVGVLSATLPSALTELLHEALEQPIEPIDGRGQGFPPRHRVRLREQHLTAPDSLSEIQRQLTAGRAVMVVANNVSDAQSLYQQLGPIARELHGPDAATLLHARFRRMDRTRLEHRVRARYGISKSGPQPGLVVSTQVIEVSLDVDFHVLHTSGATLEALLQRFGRVNRLAMRPTADVIVHPPGYAPRKRGGPEEYADGVYPRAPVEAAWQLLARHDGQAINDADVTGWLDSIYATPWGQSWRDEVRMHCDDFTRAFLTFKWPFDSREHLADDFDRLFEGTEAILAADKERYTERLATASGAVGRLHAEEFLIPLPVRGPRGDFDREIGVHVVDADYDEEVGLTTVRPRQPTEVAAYVPGEVI